MLRIDLELGDLAGTRFAISPLFETIAALRTLRDPGRHALHLPWVRWAQGELAGRPLAVPHTWALLVEPPREPEFLMPAPAARLPGLDEELDRMLATPAAHARARLARLFAPEPAPAVAAVIAAPRRGLRALAAEIREAFDRLIAPHWSRMQAVLDGDVVHRARTLAEGGAARLLPDLHPDLTWHGDHLLARSHPGDDGPVRTVGLAPGGLVLLPSVFVWPELYVKTVTITQTTIRYPARGVVALWEAIDGAAASDGALERLLGARRAELLEVLRTPHATGELARRLEITPSAVSQHLRVLRDAGLVTSARAGRRTLHMLTALGEALADA